MTLINPKRLQYVLVLISLLVFGASLYFQYIKGMEPCPLCIMQRICVLIIVCIGIAMLFIKAILRVQKMQLLQIVFAGAGLFFAGRQLWLQSLPADQVPACLPGLDVMVKYFPLKDVMHALFWGSGDCAEVNWQWLGLSMPAWSALYFLFIIIGSMIIYYLNEKSL
ncbi:disulfide bond formation protein DsbB [Legionella quinlivanii]|uniref:Disulfide bond formation protein B n=1 Tax=Legionella quinlivanii TaxID=45073 RepID=A0A0W0XYD0_9GAMM|nr:disulfide bond formation protein B [Legionella quinlivanii]KTD49739.1 disulfide bond formation protein DsbB [Legionella quinlivanii]MCW8451899.1 disulfide bond formation protein B [Legionella quinlivanii]SEG23725.1 disulfide bond formation protein DsbB [Legionella quinlivanii DSM 21216]STY09904.1 Disulfide bond formation protein B (Disulfide oxidoreductase) [Legionella quinlivanii]